MQQSIIQIIIPLLLIPFLLWTYFRLRLKKLAQYKSEKLGNITVIEKYNKERVLTINYYAQGISIEKKSIKQSYWFTVAESAVKFCKGKKNPRILMLGLGANTISNLIDRLNPKIHQTIVEFDDKIIQACREYFYLDQLTNFKLIQSDVYKLLAKKNAFDKNFDAIIIDIFTGDAPFVDLKSNKSDFMQKIIRYLKRDGLIIFNRPAHNEPLRNGGKELKECLSNYFKKTKLLNVKDPRGYQNNVITGSFKK